MLLKALKIHVLTIVGIIIFPAALFSQDTNNNNSDFPPDSIFLDGGSLISFRDTLIQNKDTLVVRKEVWIKYRDSLVLIVDSLSTKEEDVCFQIQYHVLKLKDTILILQDTIFSRNERVLQQIKEFSERKNVFSKLLKNVLVFESARSYDVSAPNPVNYSEKKYEPYEGKIIRSIEVKVLDVFGATLINPELKPRGILQKGGNAIHIKSHRWLIRDRLLFKKGDRFNSLKISESERLFRNNSYIYDAKIIVKDTSCKDSVDVLVMVQDVWSISVGAGVDAFHNIYDFSLNDVNFLGLGQMLESKARINSNLPKGYNLYGAYTIQNIYRTFITSRSYYTFVNGETRYGIGFNRDFISPAMKWAGGGNMDAYEGFNVIKNSSDSILVTEPVRSVKGDYWLGYGFNISGHNSNYKGSRLILSGRMIRTNYFERPHYTDSIRNLYSDSRFYLSSIGFIRRRFYKDSYIFRFGRTEDIPEGDLIAFTAGVEDKITRRRPYFGVNMATSRYISFGYIYTRFGLGSFYDYGQWKEGVMLAHLLYFSPLLKLREWKLRNFFGARFTNGIYQNTGVYVNINQEQGLRGFTSDVLKGTSKLVVNYELDIFPPLNLVGFRIAMIGFVDLGWITQGNKLIDKKNFFPGYGVGMRIRNDHLIFNTIQLMLGFYPNNSVLGSRNFLLFERNHFYYNYYDFTFSKPSQVPFN